MVEPRRRRAWPRAALLGLALLLGSGAGVGGFTFVYARGGSYRGTTPLRAPTAT
jgi:hypothetical protein